MIVAARNGSKAVITERDLAVVLDVYKYRYVTAAQIQRLHFPSLQTTYRRLRALVELGYLKTFAVPNIPERLYHLSQSGAELVAAQLSVEVADLKWSQTSHAPKDYYFLRHFLKAGDFRIALKLACQGADIQLLGFIPEYYGEKTSGGSPVKYIKDFVCDITDVSTKINHTPDGVFALMKNQVPALFFLEIDRGTEVISDAHKGVLKSVRFYLNYLVSGGYSRYQEDFQCSTFKGFRTLIVTTSVARIDNIRREISRLSFADKAKKLIWLTIDTDVSETSLFQPIWQSADLTDGMRYRIG
jgi:DNA-binding PadR family transcriptional regulator